MLINALKKPDKCTFYVGKNIVLQVSQNLRSNLLIRCQLNFKNTRKFFKKYD